MPRNKNRSARAASLFSVLALAFFTGAAAAAGDGVTANLLSSPPTAPSVMADFDGDHKLDLATLGVLDQVQVQRATEQVPVFTPLIHPSANRLRARDLDGDNDRDLVLESPFHVPLEVWINDGAGNFHVGDLEAFRFQLSHDDPLNLGFSEHLLAPFRTAECPRRGVVIANPLYCDSAPVVTHVLVRDRDHVVAGHDFSLRTRGPPPLS